MSPRKLGLVKWISSPVRIATTLPSAPNTGAVSTTSGCLVVAPMKGAEITGLPVARVRRM